MEVGQLVPGCGTVAIVVVLCPVIVPFPPTLGGDRRALPPYLSVPVARHSPTSPTPPTCVHSTHSQWWVGV